MPHPRGYLPPVLLGGLGGALFSLSIPKPDIQLFGWISLFPCLYYIFAAGLSTEDGKRARDGEPDHSNSLAFRQTLILGISFGLISGLGRVYWLAETLERFGNLSRPEALLTGGLLILYLALYPASFFLVCRRLSCRSPLLPWIAAAVWTLLEWAQTWIITGFPWELLGYSQYLNRPLRQLASLTGVYGVSFVLVLVNVALSQLLATRRRVLATCLPIAVLMAAVAVYGSSRYAWLTSATSSARSSTTSEAELKVGVIQGSVIQEVKWKPDRARTITQRYADLTRQLASKAPLDLVVFPETALPYWFRDDRFSAYRGEIEQLARDVSTPILVGSLEMGLIGGEAKIYNRAFLLDREGRVVDFSDKVHLVPFGEYLPMPWLFQYLEGLTAESGPFAPGDGRKVLALPQTDITLGVFICYESIFPGITRELAKLGATVLVNTTNDAWFGRTAAPRQHLSMAVFRAVETGRPIVRAANTGISCAISPAGDISQATQLFETAAFSVAVVPRSTSTFYTRHGDVFLAACALFLLATFVAHRLRPRGRIAS